MGFWSKLRERLSGRMRAFDEQVEGYGLPADGARPPQRPSVGPRNIITQADMDRDRRREAPVVRPPSPVRRPPVAPPTARHRLDPDRRPRDDSDAVAGVGFDMIADTPSSNWIDPEPHRHSGHHHHGSTAPAAPETTTHHGGGVGHDHGNHGNHGYDSGSGGGAGHDHGSGGGGGGYDG